MTKDDLKLLVAVILLALLDVLLVINFISIKAVDVDLVKLIGMMP